MSTGPHTKVSVSEFHNRRTSDKYADALRHQAIGFVFDHVTDREVKLLTFEEVSLICRKFEARLKALGGEL